MNRIKYTESSNDHFNKRVIQELIETCVKKSNLHNEIEFKAPKVNLQQEAQLAKRQITTMDLQKKYTDSMSTQQQQ